MLVELIALTMMKVYIKHAVMYKDKMVIYMWLCKEIYSCLCSSILLHCLLLEELESLSFELNPHVPCIAIKMVNWNFFSIVCHVENLKLSHVEPVEVTNIIYWIYNNHGKTKIGGWKNIWVPRDGPISLHSQRI